MNTNLLEEAESIEELKKKYSLLDNKYTESQKEASEIYKQWKEIDKLISLYYQKEFIDSNKDITDIYFKYYNCACHITKLKNIFGDVISITALSVKFNSEICLDNFNLTWKEIFDNLITKESFEEELRKTIETLGLSDNLVQKIELKTEPDKDIWIQSSTNNFQIN